MCILAETSPGNWVTLLTLAFDREMDFCSSMCYMHMCTYVCMCMYSNTC